MPRRVLVADDDSLFLKLLQFTLEQSGMDWIVETSASGQETIDSITVSEPDLLVLDLKMPNGDGFSVLEQRKQMEKQFPVLVVTHLSDDEHVTRCQELGATEVVQKSTLRIGDLVLTMQRTLGVA